MKKLLLIALLLLSSQTVYAAPQYTVSRTILPETTNLYELGTTTRQWLNLFSRNASTTNATTTNLGLPNIADGLLKVATGVVQRATPDGDYQVPLTFGDGLTRTVNDVDCDTANASTFGCLTSADWASFNNKVSTSSLDEVWSMPGLGSVGSSTATTTFPGNVRINGILQVIDRIIATTLYVVDEVFYNGMTGPNFTATSTSVASIFPYASTTALTVTNTGTGLHVASNSLFENTAGVTNLTVGDGSTVQTKRVALNSPANDASQSQIQFQQAGTAKWSIYRAGNTDALNIYSHTLATDVVRTTTATTSLLSNDVNIIGTGAAGATFWNNEGSASIAPGSLTIGQATPGNGFRVTRVGGTDTAFARFTEAGGAFAQFIDGTGISLDFRDTGVNSRVNFNTNGNNYIAPATGDVYFIPAAGSVAVGTTTPPSTWAFQVASAKKPFVLSDTSAPANLKHWLLSSMGGNLYFSTSTDSYASSTPSAFTLNGTGLPSLQIGTTTCMITLTNGSICQGGSSNSSTTNATGGKLQWQYYNSDGALVCEFVKGTTRVIQLGACN